MSPRSTAETAYVAAVAAIAGAVLALVLLAGCSVAPISQSACDRYGETEAPRECARFEWAETYN